MLDSFSSCPQCNATVLPDTVQCPDCGHIFDESRVAQLPGEVERAETNKPHGEESPCPTCGESVRIGMVRCWNCGSFMRDDIARTYEQMQSTSPGVIYSIAPLHDAPEGKLHVPTGESAATARLKTVTAQHDGVEGAGGVSTDSEADFELGAGLEFETMSDDDFEISPEFDLLDAADASTPPVARVATPQETAESATYSVSTPTASASADAAPVTATSAPENNQQTESTAAEPSDVETPQDQDASATAAEKVAPDDGAVHSQATAGDALLQAALAEEAEASLRKSRPQKSQKKKRKAIDGFLVFCPQGHRIEVQEKHRGKLGKCPKCKSPFLVPEKPAEEPEQKSDETAPAAESADTTSDAGAAGSYKRWLKDISLHVVNPQKLKLKPGSLQKEFVPVDLGFSEVGFLLATLVKPGGLFGANEKKKEAAREALLAALREEVPFSDLPVASKQEFASDQLQQLKVEQPAAYEYESIFHGIAVFGEGRIAIRLPRSPEVEFPQYLSFWLSEFRQFARNLMELYGVEELGADSGIPLTDATVEAKCHYSDEPISFLESPALYQADPAIELKVVGRKCAECGLIVSEDSRKKEKIGGANGKSIARAKCPKCEKKFGDISLYAVVSAEPAKPQEAAAAE